jgi:ribosome assembly protein YihI (activator of Der GTPase)
MVATASRKPSSAVRTKPRLGSRRPVPMKLGQLLARQRPEDEPAQAAEVTLENRRIDVQPPGIRSPVSL